MLLLLLFFVMLLAYGLCFYLQKLENKKSRPYYDFTSAKWWWLILAGVVFVSAIIVYSATNYSIKQTKEKIVTMQTQKKIFEERKTILMIQYTSMLDSNYGSYEKGLFNKMVAKQVKGNVAVNIYPEIKYSATLISLSDRLQKLTDDIYQFDISIENERLWLRTIHFSPFLFDVFLTKT